MKWEYKEIGYFPTTLEELLAKMGNEGWELCAINSDIHPYRYYFKRPIPEPQLAPPPIKD